MADGESNGHMTDDITWPWEVKHLNPIRFERNLENSWRCCLLFSKNDITIQVGPNQVTPLYIFGCNRLMHKRNFMIFGTNKLYKATNGMLPILC